MSARRHPGVRPLNLGDEPLEPRGPDGSLLNTPTSTAPEAIERFGMQKRFDAALGTERMSKLNIGPRHWRDRFT